MKYHLIKTILRLFSLTLMLLPIADFMESGSIAITSANLKSTNNENTGKQNMVVSLPYSIGNRGKDIVSYEMSFALPVSIFDKWSTIEFVEDNCDIGMIRNGDHTSIERKSMTCNRDYSGGSVLIPRQSGDNTNVLITIKPDKLKKLSVVRQIIFDPLQIFLIELVGFYLLALSMAGSKKALYEFNYVFLVLGLFVFTSFPIFDADRNSIKLYLGSAAQWVAIPAIVFISMASQTMRKLFSPIGQLLTKVRSFPAYIYVPCCMLIFLCLSASLSSILFDNLPHVSDSDAQYIHSKIMASGRFYDISHPLRQFFELQNVYNNGKYYSHYPPGHIIFLAIGQLLHAPWLVNPTLGALTVGVIYLLACEIANKTAGYIAAALTLICPFMLLMSSEYMNHATALLFATLSLYAYIRFQKTNDWRFASLFGASLGYALISRPQALLFFTFPIVLHALWQFFKAPRHKAAHYILLVTGFMIPIAFFLYYNAVTGGDPLRPNQGGDAERYVTSFVNHYQWHDIYNQARLVLLQSAQLHTNLFGWPTSSLLFVAILFLFRAQPKYASLLFACCISQFLGLLIVPFFDGIFVPRYLYETSGCFIVLTAICLNRLPDIAYKISHTKLPTPSTSGAIAAMIALLVFLGMPLTMKEKYDWYKDNYWEGNAAYYHAVMDNVKEPALVFVKNYDEYRMFSFTQPPRDDSPVIFAQDLGDNDQMLINYYPLRSVYSFNAGILERLK